VVSASRDGTVRFWDAMSGLCVKTLGDQPGTIGEATAMRLSSDGSLVLTSSRHGAVRLWDLRSTAKPLVRYKGHQNSASSFIRCCFGAKESVVLSGSDDGAIRMWDTATGAPLTTLKGHSGATYRCEWSSKQSMVASCSEDGTLRTWSHQSQSNPSS
jgi:COMPASS component SWD3